MTTFGTWYQDQNVTHESVSFRDRLAEKFALLLVRDDSEPAQCAIDALRTEGDPFPRATWIAETAYALADAMLKARQQEQA